MTLTYLDTSILIAAAIGTHEGHKAAMRILDDPEREFVSSKYLELELLPKPTRENEPAELEFYQMYFSEVKAKAKANEETVDAAILEASLHNIRPLDALHIASAVAVGAEELVTGEKKKSEFFRTTSITITSVRT